MNIAKVIVIDDDESTRILLEMSLSKIGGFKVECFSSGKSALDNIKKEPLPDIILLDAHLGDLDGIDVINHLRLHQEYKRVPIVMVTAETRLTELERLRQAGAAEVIIKPFDPLTLPAQIQQIHADYHSKE